MNLKKFAEIMQNGSYEKKEETLTKLIDEKKFSEKLQSILCNMRDLNESISRKDEVLECSREFFRLLQVLLNMTEFRNSFVTIPKEKSKTESLSGVDYYGDPDEYQEEFLETDDFPKRRFDSEVPGIGEVYIDSYGNRIRRTL